MPAMVFETFLSTSEMAQVFDDAAFIQAMMDFEAALARAQAKAGLMPASMASAIASLCRVELYDVEALLLASSRSGSLAAPVVQKLTETVALFDPVSSAYVHWGACCQDVIDTAMVLQTRRALQLIETDLLHLCGQLLDLAELHEVVPMLARGQLQPMQVSSLRFKLVGWLLPLLRSAEALRRQSDEGLQSQFGGASGTLSAMGDAADAVLKYLSDDLRLAAPVMPWHTQRDRWLRVGAEVGILCGALGKLATDLSLLSQPEVGELGVSAISVPGAPATTAAKRHPLAPMQALVAVQRAPQRVAALMASMNQAHERGLGTWHTELPEWADLLLCAHGSVRSLSEAVAQFHPQPQRMLHHIEQTQDLAFAEPLLALLTQTDGRPRALQMLEGLVARVRQGEGRLSQLAGQLLEGGAERNSGLTASKLQQVFDPRVAARWADARVRPALAEARQQWESLLASPRLFY